MGEQKCTSSDRTCFTCCDWMATTAPKMQVKKGVKFILGILLIHAWLHKTASKSSSKCCSFYEASLYKLTGKQSRSLHVGMLLITSSTVSHKSPPFNNSNHLPITMLQSIPITIYGNLTQSHICPQNWLERKAILSKLFDLSWVQALLFLHFCTTALSRNLQQSAFLNLVPSLPSRVCIRG